MRLAHIQKANRYFSPSTLKHTYSCGEDFGRMWRDRIPTNVMISDRDLGMVVISQQQIKRGSLALANRAREICLFDKLHQATVQDGWVTCNDGSLIAWYRNNEPESVCENAIEGLSPHFYFKDSRIVVQFLERNPELCNVLLETRHKFDSYFGTETRSRLELFIDPEDEDNNPRLFALILTSLSSEEASTILDQLDEEWWLDQPFEVRRLMNIDVEYVDAAI